MTRSSVASLCVGLTRHEVLARLGAPLFAGPMEGKEILTYAYAGDWHLGSRTRWHGGGVAFVVECSDGILESAYFSNSSVKEPKLCTCTRVACPESWADSCLRYLAE